jgi:hypothetical protein
MVSNGNLRNSVGMVNNWGLIWLVLGEYWGILGDVDATYWVADLL